MSEQKTHSVLSDVRNALAAPRGDAGVDARMLALESVQNLKEQLESLADVLREIPAMEREGYNAKQLADYVTAALEQASIPASSATASTDAVSPAPGHQRSDLPESRSESSPASSPPVSEREPSGADSIDASFEARPRRRTADQLPSASSPSRSETGGSFQERSRS